VAEDGSKKPAWRQGHTGPCQSYLVDRRSRAESEARQREHDAFLAGLAALKYGMSHDQVIGLLGRPTNVNESGGRWGTHDQWIYKYRGYLRPVYLYFQDGRFASWQK
jgi:hypothetical protein